MHVNLLKLYPYACKLTDINSGCIQTYEAYRFTVTYILLLGNCLKRVEVNSRWGSIISIFVFDWGFINIIVGWGCNQDWGFNRADTV